MVQYSYTPYPFELNMSIATLLLRLWKKKDHKNICNCDLIFGECLAKLNWTIDRLRQKWKTSYVDFDTAIAKVLDQDPCFINFDEIAIYHVDEFESLLQKYIFF